MLGRYERAALARIRRRLPAAVARKVDPEDVLQEAFLVAATRLGEFVPEGKDAFGRWFARIVELKVRETLRRHVGVAQRSIRREVTRGARPDTALAQGREPAPSEMARTNERREAARDALGRMDAAQREILELVQFEGLPLRDLATRLGCSYEAAKKRYARALEAFRTALAATRGPDEADD